MRALLLELIALGDAVRRRFESQKMTITTEGGLLLDALLRAKEALK